MAPVLNTDTPRLRTWMSRVAIALSVALLVAALTVEEILHLGIFQRLELTALDYRFQARGADPSISDSSNVVIVEIDGEASRSLPEAFPFPRSYYARLVRNLQRAGARAVGIDLGRVTGSGALDDVLGLRVSGAPTSPT